MMKGAPRRKSSALDPRKKTEPIIVRHFNPILKKNFCNDGANFPQVPNGDCQYHPVFKLVDTLLNSASNKNCTSRKCVRKRPTCTPSNKSKQATKTPVFSSPIVNHCNQTRIVKKNGTTIISRVGGNLTSRSTSSCGKKVCPHNKKNSNPECYPLKPLPNICRASNYYSRAQNHQCQDKIKTNINNIGSDTNLRLSLKHMECNRNIIVPTSERLELDNEVVHNSNKICGCSCGNYMNKRCAHTSPVRSIGDPKEYIEKLKEEINFNKSRIAEDARKIINELKAEILSYRHFVKPTYSSSYTDMSKANKNDTLSTVPQLHHYTLDLVDQVKENAKIGGAKTDKSSANNQKECQKPDDPTENLTSDEEKMSCQREKPKDVQAKKTVPASKTEKKSTPSSPKKVPSGKASCKESKKEVSKDPPETIECQQKSKSGNHNVVTLWQCTRAATCSSTTDTERTESSSAPADINFDDKLEEANSLIEKVKVALKDIGKAIPQRGYCRDSRESSPEKAAKSCQEKFEKVLGEMEKVLQQSLELTQNSEKQEMARIAFPNDCKSNAVKCICAPKFQFTDRQQDEGIDYIIERIPLSGTGDVPPCSSESVTMQVLQEKLGAISEMSSEGDTSADVVSVKGDASGKSQTSTNKKNLDSVVERSCSPVIPKAECRSKPRVSVQCKVAQEEKIRIEGRIEKLSTECPAKSKCNQNIVPGSSIRSKSTELTTAVCLCEDVESDEEENILNDNKSSYDCIPCREPKETKSKKKLSIQVMPPIHIGRGLVMQRTLNLSIKPTGSTVNTLVAQNANVGYREVKITSKETVVRPSGSVTKKSSPQESKTTQCSGLPQSGELQNFSKLSDREVPTSSVSHSDDEHRTGTGGRRNTRTLLDSTRMNESKILILKSFQVMESCPSVSIPLSQHSFPVYSTMLPVVASSESSRVNSSASSGVNVSQSSRAKESRNYTNRSPWDFGFYLSKATQCDDSYFTQSQTLDTYKYSTGTYVPSMVDELTVIPEKDVTLSLPSPNDRRLPDLKKIEEDLGDSDEEDDESDDEFEESEEDEESLVVEVEKIEKVIEPVTVDQDEDYKDGEVLVIDDELEEKQSPDETSEEEEEEEEKDHSASYNSQSILSGQSGGSRAFTPQLPNNTIEEEASGSFDQDGEPVVELLKEAVKELNDDSGGEMIDSNVQVSLGSVSESEYDEIFPENVTSDKQPSRHDSIVTEVMLDEVPSKMLSEMLPAKDNLENEKSEIKNHDSSSTDSSEFYQGLPRQRSNTISTFIQGLTGTSHDEFQEVAQPINKSLSRMSGISKRLSQRLSHKNIAIENSERELATTDNVSELSEAIRQISQPIASDERKTQRLKLFQKLSYEEHDMADSETNSGKVPKNNEHTVMTVSINKNRIKSTDNVLPIYKRVLGRFDERHHAQNRNQKMAVSQSDQIPIDESISEGEINCKHTISNGEVHLCKFANGVMERVRHISRGKAEKAARKEIRDQSLKIARQRTQYNSWITCYLQKQMLASLNDSSSCSSASFKSNKHKI